MATRSEAIGELERLHDKFRGMIASLPESAYDEIWLGTWGLPQLLAHMSGWFKEMTYAMERVGRGERPVPEGVSYADGDAWNAKFVSTATPGIHSLAVFDAYYKRYVAAARQLSEDRFGVDETGGRPLIGNRLLQASGIGHFEEHLPEVERWLAARAGR